MRTRPSIVASFYTIISILFLMVTINTHASSITLNDSIKIVVKNARTGHLVSAPHKLRILTSKDTLSCQNYLLRSALETLKGTETMQFQILIESHHIDFLLHRDMLIDDLFGLVFDINFDVSHQGYCREISWWNGAGEGLISVSSPNGSVTKCTPANSQSLSLISQLYGSPVDSGIEDYLLALDNHYADLNGVYRTLIDTNQAIELELKDGGQAFLRKFQNQERFVQMEGFWTFNPETGAVLFSSNEPKAFPLFDEQDLAEVDYGFFGAMDSPQLTLVVYASHAGKYQQTMNLDLIRQ